MWCQLDNLIVNTDVSQWKRGVVEDGGEVLCGKHPHATIAILGTLERLIKLAVSQFTLLASVKKGNKPDFHRSANGNKAKELYQAFFKKVQELYEPDKVKDGVFAAMMDVALVNDGPVGIDYTCLDGEVLPQHPFEHMPKEKTLCSFLAHK